MQNIPRVIYKALYQLLRPLVKILLDHGISASEFTEVVRRVYVDVAEKDFQIPGKKQSTSRISVVTGLNRTEVARIRDLSGEEPEDAGWLFHNRAARVVSGWSQDEAYQSDGKPKNLPLEGENSFSDLVKNYSGGMPVRAVLDELLRVGTAEKAPNGDIHLCQDVYVPHQSNEELLRYMGEAASDLLHTIEHNLNSTIDESRLQLSVAYDNLPIEAVEKFKQLSRDEAVRLLKQWDAWLAQFDRDANPEIKGTGRLRAGVGVYFFEDDLEPKD